MFKMFYIFCLSLLVAGLPLPALAHCPLCTVGAGTLAIIASSLGVSTAAVGVFIGAFAVALGLWFARLIKKQFIPGQKWVLAIASFVLTVWPLMPLLRSKYASVYISWFGDYGTIFNRTYILDWFIVGSLAGAALMIISPWLSRIVSRIWQGRRFAYQGITITFLSLLAASIIFQLVVK